MKELEERISEIINDWTCSDEGELTLDERNRSTELAKEIKDIAMKYAVKFHHEITSETFDQFIKERYKP